MRHPQALLALAILAGTASPAFAGEQSLKVHVKLHVVAKPCVVQAPATVAVDRLGRPVLILSSVLADCAHDDAPATLTVKADSADKGTDVATINF
ncbi:MAG TPA: hypothetical protein VGG89_16765 [Candidatus Baltobacteraceae bacterium]|jgi:type 1 fimbria pilin